MAPGLISSLPQNEQASASSTASSSRQASPVLHAVEADARAKMGASPGTDANATQGGDMALLVESGLVDQLKKRFAISTEQKNQFDELLNTWQSTYKMPRFARAYSEGCLPPPTTTDYDHNGNHPRNAPQKDRRYQATVEDCTESEDDEDTPTASCGPHTYTTRRDSDSEPAGHNRGRAFAASAPTSPRARPTLTTENTAPAALPVTKEVRFSNRVPVVLQRSSSARHTAWTGGGGSSASQQANVHLPREKFPSPLDEKWGVLFTPQGKATLRMRNVLRGLAIYLTEAYKPAYSLVMTPEKLYKFYCKYKLDREYLDFTKVFSLPSRGAMRSLEKLYLDMQCDYHLVQENSPGSKDWPYIPALTPEGFVQWTVMLIRAYPDQEAARLGRVIADLPLEAAPEDPSVEMEQRERLPRKITRHIFPVEPNQDALQLVTRAMREWRHGPGSDRPPTQELRHAASTGGRATIAQSSPPPLAPPLIHSDSRSRHEHLNRCRRNYENEVVMEVPRATKRSSSPDREGQSPRYVKSHARQENPRRPQRYNRRDSKDSERDRHRKDGRWSVDGNDESRYRRRDGRGSRS